MKVATPGAMKLFHDGAQELARIEANGIRIDLGYLDEQIERVGNRVAYLGKKLKGRPEYTRQQKMYGTKCRLTSRQQLAKVLKNDGHKVPETAKGNLQLDEAVMKKINTKYCSAFQEMEKLRKLQATHMMGIRRAVDACSLLHPSFNLHTVLTYRGSSSDPNFQNIPIRDPDLGKIIRRCFIPRSGHVLLEIDLKANEVRVAGSYTGDERLIHDTIKGDMHGDMAAEVFYLPRDRVPKAVRQEVKGKFVFAEFYGDYWGQVSENLWEAVDGLKTLDDTPMIEHLASNGIIGHGGQKDPAKGTFADHIRTVEDRFWNERYHVYNQWKIDQFDEYCRRGWYDMHTGFVCRGIYSRNQVNNGPIQGSAFHCLLWVLIRLNRWLRKHKMRTLIVGQIHDSIEFDAHKNELEDVKVKAKELLEVSIMKAWPWVVVPLAGEAEVAKTNWYEKREVKF